MTGGTPVALTIAGSDSGAGAGVQADLRTFAALGVYGVSALTAVTAQNTRGVRAVENLSAAIVAAQVEAIFEDFNVAAVKIGMLSNRRIVEAVAEALVRFSPRFVVLDPVMISSSGDALVEPTAVSAMKTLLLPLVDCLTPNLAEAAQLLGGEVAADEAGMTEQALALLKCGPRAVLMKGGHLHSAEAVDILATRAGSRRYAGARIASRNLHGTGCTLSAAAAAYIVLGRELEEAVAGAKAFVARAIEAGREAALGRGPGPLLQLPLARVLSESDAKRQA
ncbi:MAG: bifunctional hydroxymethylpyrimidine kinase/phosphomethylpyrimidine kinase [Roseiarcus sp.]